MADAAKKPALTLAQIADNQRQIGSLGNAGADLVAQEARLYARLLEFAFSDAIPPAVSLAAQRDALDRVRFEKESARLNASDEPSSEDVDALVDRYVAARDKQKRS